MSLLKKIFNKYKAPLTVFAFAVSLFSISSVVFGQIIRPPASGGSPDDGKVFGFAWMGTGIENPDVSEGGGGWLKFNCEPDFCEEGGRPWGVQLDLVSPPDRLNPLRSNYGALTGNAWSSNYGWLSFDPNIVRSCWESYPSSPQFVAKAIALDDPDPILGQTRKLAGWGKFMNGDDVADDGYDGCVNFAGADYGVSLNISTGALTGWAWGGNVVGWISFQNPECPFCDTSVVLPGSANITFWAEDPVVQPGGLTRLHWEALNSPTKSVVSCLTYDNTSNYTHWRSSANGAGNVGPINTTVGNLPTGSHFINGINQTTTYSLTCRASDGQTLTTKYATVAVGIKGCMDPIALNYDPLATIPSTDCTYDPIPGCMFAPADNYNPLATVEDGSCMEFGCTDPLATNFEVGATVNDGTCTYNPGTPVITLDVFASSFVAGSGSYNTGLIDWTSNNNPLINSCSGSFFVDGVLQNLSGWSGNRAIPNNSISNINMTSIAGSATAGTVFRFTLTCQSNNGTTILPVSDTIIMTSGPIDPPDPLPVVDLRILTPDNGGGTDQETLSSAGAVITLGWTVQNATSCSGSSSMLGQGPNNSWNSYTFSPALGTRTMDMTVGSSYHYPSLFTLTCVNADGASNSDSVNVVIDGVPCPPGAPECAPGAGSNIPGYEEF